MHAGVADSGSPGASATPSGSGSHPAVRSPRVVRMCICRVRAVSVQADLAHREQLTRAWPVGDVQLDLGVGQCPGVGAAVLVGVHALAELVLVEVGDRAFAPGQGVEPGRVQVGEQRRGPAAPVEPDQHPTVVADHGAQVGSTGAARRPARRPVRPSPPAADPPRRRRPTFPPWPGPGTSTAAHGFSRSAGCPDRRVHARRHTAPPTVRAGPARAWRAIAAIQSPARPASASSPILRRIVLTSGARSNPSTRPSAGGSIRVAPSARASPSRARNTLSHNIVSSE